MRRVAVIGSGFSGLSASCFLAAAGFDVKVLKKNGTPGGRAHPFEVNGFTFDMGSSWYWMPDVFENFFNHYNKKPTDYYELKRIDPSYHIIFNDHDRIDVPANIGQLRNVFDQLENGRGNELLKFLEEARLKYELASNKLVYLPGLKTTELVDAKLIRAFAKT